MRARFVRKIAIVTGGGGEIGRATAMRLSREGATVVVVDCDKDQAEKVAAEITGDGGQSWACRTGVAERDQVEAMAGAVFGRHGRIDSGYATLVRRGVSQTVRLVITQTFARSTYVVSQPANAGARVKPGVERSGTPWIRHEKTHQPANAGDSHSGGLWLRHSRT